MRLLVRAKLSKASYLYIYGTFFFFFFFFFFCFFLGILGGWGLESGYGVLFLLAWLGFWFRAWFPFFFFFFSFVLLKACCRMRDSSMISRYCFCSILWEYG